MRRRLRALRRHPIVKALLFERLLLTGSATLAFAAVAMGRVKPAEIPGLLDRRLLSLFFVLTVAVELGKDSDLFDRLVAAVVTRVRTARGLAAAMIGITGLLAALLTNDVALLLVVPFTMLFRRVTDLDLAPIVVLEIASANLLGSLTPIGNPQNLFLYTRGGFTPSSFIAAQAPWVAGASLALLLAVPLRVPRKALGIAEMESFEVDPLLAGACFALLAAEVAALFGRIHHVIPLALALGGAILLGRRIREADFSLVFVFAFLFVGIAGLERGRLYLSLAPERIFGHQAGGLVVSGALLSQMVSNVPAAMLLSPAATAAGALRGLLYGVNAGGCGTPIASLANLIGAQIFLKEGGDARSFWRHFWPLSAVLLIILILWSLALVSL